MSAAIEIESLVVRYGERRAVDGLSLAVEPGEIFGLLGPNGGGKTSLFRVLCTSLSPASGHARIAGHDTVTAASEVRRVLGVVFQEPSIDAKLTVRENLRHQGHLYGMRGAALKARIGEVLAGVGLAERAGERAERLSGGQKRRVELAKGLLHRPQVLLLDEPSTGLDPGARRDLWGELLRLREATGVTILLTTHLLDEADRCDRVAIVNAGKIVALDTPRALKRAIEGDVITVETADPAALATRLGEALGVSAKVLDGAVRIEHPDGPALVADVMRRFPDDVTAVTVGQPTLEDVFIRTTGHTLWEAAA